MLSVGCVSSTRWVEVHLADAKRVDVEPPQTAQLLGNDVLVDGKSVLADQGMRGRAPLTVVHAVADPPDALRVKDGRYAWRRGAVTASTPVDNVKSAEVATMWTQPFGVLPSLGGIVVGGVCAIGFGVAGGASLANAANGDKAQLGEGIGLTSAAVVGAAAAVYGLVTFNLVQGPPSYQPLRVVDQPRREPR
jgi:hypothetical protein